MKIIAKQAEDINIELHRCRGSYVETIFMGFFLAFTFKPPIESFPTSLISEKTIQASSSVSENGIHNFGRNNACVFILLFFLAAAALFVTKFFT
jgi:hypothetical protein